MKYSMLLASMATTLMAAPVAPYQFEWTPTLAGYFDVVFQYMQQAKTPGRPPVTCDLSRAAMPVAPTPLPFPPGLVLEHVAVGRGVQVRIVHPALSIPSVTDKHRTIHVPMPQRLPPPSVQSRGSTMPPASPPTGQIYLVSFPTWRCSILFLPTQLLLWRHQISSSRRTTSSPTPRRLFSHSTPPLRPTLVPSSQQKATLRTRPQMQLPALAVPGTALCLGST
jgi:hypothetical protein